MNSLPKSIFLGDERDSPLPLFWGRYCWAQVQKLSPNRRKVWLDLHAPMLERLHQHLDKLLVVEADTVSALVKYLRGSTSHQDFTSTLRIPIEAPEFEYWLQVAESVDSQSIKLMAYSCHLALPIDINRLNDSQRRTHLKIIRQLCEILLNSGDYQTALSIQNTLPEKDLTITNRKDVHTTNEAISLATLFSSALLCNAEYYSAWRLLVNVLGIDRFMDNGQNNQYLIDLSEHLGDIDISVFIDACSMLLKIAKHTDNAKSLSEFLWSCIGVLDLDWGGIELLVQKNYGASIKTADLPKFTTANYSWIKQTICGPSSDPVKLFDGKIGWMFKKRDSLLAKQTKNKRTIPIALSELETVHKEKFRALVLKSLLVSRQLERLAFITEEFCGPFLKRDNPGLILKNLNQLAKSFEGQRQLLLVIIANYATWAGDRSSIDFVDQSIPTVLRLNDRIGGETSHNEFQSISRMLDDAEQLVVFVTAYLRNAWFYSARRLLIEFSEKRAANDQVNQITPHEIFQLAPLFQELGELNEKTDRELDSLWAIRGCNVGKDVVNTAHKIVNNQWVEKMGVTSFGSLLQYKCQRLRETGKVSEALVLGKAWNIKLCEDYYARFQGELPPLEHRAEVARLFESQLPDQLRLVQWIVELGKSALAANKPADALEAIVRVLEKEQVSASRSEYGFSAIINLNSPELLFDVVEVFARGASAQSQVDDAVNVLKAVIVGKQFDDIQAWSDFARVLGPLRRVKYFQTCLECIPQEHPDFMKVARAAVKHLTSILYEEISNGKSRWGFLRGLKQIRNLLVKKHSCWLSNSDTSIGESDVELMTWCEQFDHRILLEEFLLNNESHCESIKSSSSHTSKPFAIRNSVWPPISDNEFYSKWKSDVQARSSVALAAIELELSESNESSETVIRTRPTKVLPDHLKFPELFSQTINTLLGESGVWLKTLFGPDDRLKWWAAKTEHNQELKVIATGCSKANARQRIIIANLKFDAQVEVIWAIMGGKLKAGINELIATLFQQNDNEDDELESIWLTLLSNKNQLSQLADWLDHLKLHKSAELFDLLSKQVLEDADIPRHLLRSFQSICDLLVEGFKTAECKSAEDLSNWKDDALNQACHEHAKSISWDLDLTQLIDLQRNDLISSQTDLVFSTDGPLLALPFEWLSIRERPLSCYFESVSTVLSASLTSLVTAEKRPGISEKNILCAVWESHKKRRHNDALAALRIGVHSEFTADDWSVLSLCDDPLATPQTVIEQLQQTKSRLVVMGGHGFYERAGIALASQKGGNLLWQGTGDFSQTDLVLMCACAVGRMKETSEGEVRGMYTRFLVNGGTAFCGARWNIDANYSVLFCLEILQEVRKPLPCRNSFSISRIINKVRKQFIVEHPQSLHAVAAFGVFGLSVEF